MTTENATNSFPVSSLLSLNFLDVARYSYRHVKETTLPSLYGRVEEWHWRDNIMMSAATLAIAFFAISFLRGQIIVAATFIFLDVVILYAATFVHEWPHRQSLEEINAALKKSVANQEGIISQLNGNLAHHEKTLSSLQRTQETLLKTQSDLQTELQEKINYISNNSEKLAETNLEIAERNKELADLQKRQAEINGELKGTQAALKATQLALDTTRKQIQTEVGKFAQLNADLARTSAELSGASSSSGKVAAGCNDLGIRVISPQNTNKVS